MFFCEICHEKADIHHIVHRHEGGFDIEINYKYLCEKNHEYVLSKQILRSGTSIGANIAESQCAISKKDFLAHFKCSFTILRM